MFGRLSLGDLSSFGSSGGGASVADDTAVTISQIATVSTKTNTTAIVGFSQVAGVDIQTDPAADFNAIATVTANGIAAYTNAAAVSQIAAVTGAGRAGYKNAVAVSQIAAVGIERTVGFSWTNSEGSAWEAQCATTGWDDAFRGDVDQLISDLKNGQINSSNVWSGLDRLLLMDTPNSADSLRYLNAPTLTATAVNSPTFAAAEGYTGNASTMEILSGYTPSTDGSNWTLNSAHLSVWVRTSSSGNAAITGKVGTTARAYIEAFVGGYGARGPNTGNTTIDFNGLADTATGLLTLNRSAAAATQTYHGATLKQTGTASATAVTDGELAILSRGGTAYWGGQASIWLVGRSFTANEQADIHDALNRYRTAREAA